MYKSIVLHERRPEFTRQRFMHHWLNVHAPMSEGVEDLYGYVCNEVVEQFELPGSRPLSLSASVDGIAQMWFEQPDGLLTLPRQPRVKEWFNDGPNFIGRRLRLVGDEKILVAPHRLSGSTPKLMLFLVRSENSDPDNFRTRIEAEFRSLGLRPPSNCGMTVAHIVGSPASSSVVGFPMTPVDTVAEVWFPDIKSAKPAATEIAGRLATIPSVELGGAFAFATVETVIRAPREIVNGRRGVRRDDLYLGSTTK